MAIKRTKHYIELKSKDTNGKYIIRVQKDCSQLQMETAVGDAFVDVNCEELIVIRDLLNEAIGEPKALTKDNESLSENQLKEIIFHLDEYGTTTDKYCYGLPTFDEEYMKQMRELIIGVIKNNK